MHDVTSLHAAARHTSHCMFVRAERVEDYVCRSVQNRYSSFGCSEQSRKSLRVDAERQQRSNLPGSNQRGRRCTMFVVINRTSCHVCPLVLRLISCMSVPEICLFYSPSTNHTHHPAEKNQHRPAPQHNVLVHAGFSQQVVVSHSHHAERN